MAEQPVGVGASGTAPAPVYFGQKTTADYQTMVDLAVSPLRLTKLDLIDFTVGKINLLGFTVKQFLKEVKVFKPYTDAKIVDKIITSAVRAGVLESSDEINVKSFVRLCRWLKVEDGQKAIQVIFKMARMEKRSRQGMSVETIAYVQIAELQRQDYLAACKRARNHYGAKIAELHRAIRQCEVEQGRHLDEIAQSFNHAASKFTEPTPQELGKGKES